MTFGVSSSTSRCPHLNQLGSRDAASLPPSRGQLVTESVQLNTSVVLCPTVTHLSGSLPVCFWKSHIISTLHPLSVSFHAGPLPSSLSSLCRVCQVLSSHADERFEPCRSPQRKLPLAFWACLNRYDFSDMSFFHSLKSHVSCHGDI